MASSESTKENNQAIETLTVKYLETRDPAVLNLLIEATLLSRRWAFDAEWDKKKEEAWAGVRRTFVTRLKYILGVRD